MSKPHPTIADVGVANRHRREQVEVNRRPFSADLGGTAEGDPKPALMTAGTLDPFCPHFSSVIARRQLKGGSGGWKEFVPYQSRVGSERQKRLFRFAPRKTPPPRTTPPEPDIVGENP